MNFIKWSRRFLMGITCSHSLFLVLQVCVCCMVYTHIDMCVWHSMYSIMRIYSIFVEAVITRERTYTSMSIDIDFPIRHLDKVNALNINPIKRILNETEIWPMELQLKTIIIPFCHCGEWKYGNEKKKSTKLQLSISQFDSKFSFIWNNFWAWMW